MCWEGREGKKCGMGGGAIERGRREKERKIKDGMIEKWEEKEKKD